MSWPTMVRLTSNSTLSSGLGELAGLICLLLCFVFGASSSVLRLRCFAGQI
jgi:hypothetical protein